VTKERFLAWKEKRKLEKEKIQDEKQKEEEKKAKGKMHGLSGRALFKYNPDLFVDDEEAVNNQEYDDRSEGGDEDYDEDEGNGEKRLYE